MKCRRHVQTIAWLWDMYQRDRLDLAPPYQRRSVWNQAFKDDFIDTVLLDYPAPSIFLFEEISSEFGFANYHVVDGKQRLTTIFEFLENKFPVSEKATTSAYRGKYFEDINVDNRTKIWQYELSVEYISTHDESIIRNIFDRFNKNVAKLTPQELRHARLEGEFIKTVEDLTIWMQEELPVNFPRIAPQSRKQMKDNELTALLLMLIEEGPMGYSQDDLDKIFVERDTEWEEKHEIEKLFKKIISLINEILLTSHSRKIEKTQLKNLADFYGLFGALKNLIVEDKLPRPDEMSERLEKFMCCVEKKEHNHQNDVIKSYLKTRAGATNDTRHRIQLVRIMEEVLQGTCKDLTK